MDRVKKVFCVEEFKSANFYKALFAEFLGTGFLVMVGCGATTSGQSTLEIALAFGLTDAVIVQAICHVSGGHINPAVTFAMLVAGHCSILRSIFYIIAQFLGSIAGASVLYGLVSSDRRSSLGLTTISGRINAGQGLVIEILITFILVLVVFAVYDAKRTDVKGSAPLSIGLSISACHLWAVPYTGSSMNTARTFGPALVTNRWPDHWVYWVGPLCGGLIAAILYKYMFEIKEREETTETEEECIALLEKQDCEPGPEEHFCIK